MCIVPFHTSCLCLSLFLLVRQHFHIWPQVILSSSSFTSIAASVPCVSLVCTGVFGFWSLVLLFCCQPFYSCLFVLLISAFFLKARSLFSDCLPRCLVFGSFISLNNLADKSLWLDDLRVDMVGRCSGKHFLHETAVNKFLHDAWRGTMLQGTFLLKRSRTNYITKTISRTLP